MTANPIRALAALLLPLGLTACFPYDTPLSKQAATPARTMAGAWRVVEIDGRFAKGNLVLASDEFRLSFCNDLNGGLKVEPDRLVPVHPLRQTERQCIGPDGGDAESNSWDIRARTIFAYPLAIERTGDTVLLINEKGSMRIRC